MKKNQEELKCQFLSHISQNYVIYNEEKLKDKVPTKKLLRISLKVSTREEGMFFGDCKICKHLMSITSLQNFIFYWETQIPWKILQIQEDSQFMQKHITASMHSNLSKDQSDAVISTSQQLFPSIASLV